MKATDLTIQDFTMMVNIIDICAERGAFKGSEFISIGQLREKLIVAATPEPPVDNKTDK